MLNENAALLCARSTGGRNEEWASHRRSGFSTVIRARFGSAFAYASGGCDSFIQSSLALWCGRARVAVQVSIPAPLQLSGLLLLCRMSQTPGAEICMECRFDEYYKGLWHRRTVLQDRPFCQILLVVTSTNEIDCVIWIKSQAGLGQHRDPHILDLHTLTLHEAASLPCRSPMGFFSHSAPTFRCTASTIRQSTAAGRNPIAKDTLPRLRSREDECPLPTTFSHSSVDAIDERDLMELGHQRASGRGPTHPFVDTDNQRG